MTDWAPLDVAIGLVLVYFILSVVASSLNEAIAAVLAAPVLRREAGRDDRSTD